MAVADGARRAWGVFFVIWHFGDGVFIWSVSSITSIAQLSCNTEATSVVVARTLSLADLSIFFNLVVILMLAYSVLELSVVWVGGTYILVWHIYLNSNHIFNGTYLKKRWLGRNNRIKKQYPQVQQHQRDRQSQNIFEQAPWRWSYFQSLWRRVHLWQG